MENKKIQNRKVELLAPAGNYEAFLGAVNAGADAVYLGGEKFSARAYADNFTTEEICRALHTAHFMGRKVYLTVNTLMKEAELSQLYDYLSPFYEEGLDGVIVQDLGALRYIGKRFPGLQLHASTQMTVTGSYGASFLKEHGVARIVPARELSLTEVRKMKESSGLEIECFIHGAMCYCYSGQCLFSSILGGRSGNRGRCAQPCRLPYQIYEGDERLEGVEYPLSLKDMCTLSYIPRLIEAGIDSFKIEGRMKKPEYAAGVTALYRKYIDLYRQDGADAYHVEKEDLDRLRSLYIRNEIQTGYYERHNGREMITLHKPSYAGNEKELLEQIRCAYLHEPEKEPVGMRAVFEIGQPACLQVSGIDNKTSVTVYGPVVEAAKKTPLKEEHIRKQLLKTGNSHVEAASCEVVRKGDIFMPVSALNELRRMGVEAYERRREERTAFDGICQKVRLTKSVDSTETVDMEKNNVSLSRENGCDKDSVPDSGLPRVHGIDILVSSYEQFKEAMEYPCRRIYVDSDLYVRQYGRITEAMENHPAAQYYLALPYVLRARDDVYLKKITKLLEREGSGVTGFLVRNLEEVSYVRTLGESYAMVPDAGLYAFNSQSVLFWAHYSREYTLPYELNGREAGRLVRYAAGIGMNTAMIVYGRISMMVTANCVKKTAGRCSGQKMAPGCDKEAAEAAGDTDYGWESGKGNDGVRLKDRYKNSFPVAVNCIHCYNIIYNSVPYSLHMQEKEVSRIHADIMRYDFTVESAQDCRRILEGGTFPYESYTTGHLKRGVE